MSLCRALIITEDILCHLLKEEQLYRASRGNVCLHRNWLVLDREDRQLRRLTPDHGAWQGCLGRLHQLRGRQQVRLRARRRRRRWHGDRHQAAWLSSVSWHSRRGGIWLGQYVPHASIPHLRASMFGVSFAGVRSLGTERGWDWRLSPHAGLSDMHFPQRPGGGISNTPCAAKQSQKTLFSHCRCNLHCREEAGSDLLCGAVEGRGRPESFAAWQRFRRRGGTLHCRGCRALHFRRQALNRLQ